MKGRRGGNVKREVRQRRREGRRGGDNVRV
jgi:hypothetical protein